ncbi:MAG TPA: hypothetical protein DG048_04255 [Pseudoalteromonas sp.]|nr:hypothetical protein [Pseudoalteromonas sp.]
MDRPLFRQAGGPMEPMPADMMPPAPAPMPAGMGAAPPPPDMGMAMEQAGAEGMAEGAALGEQYMAETLMGIDQAQDVESLINGLRGNEMPLQARYAELAEFVGPEDAQATPESVLALTQPGIMMTEQGAANSGIGQLMQGMVDDVAMTTDTGPTPMGQGVGELMMSGAQGAPVPQNFRYGGAVGMHQGTPVQKFQSGAGVFPLTSKPRPKKSFGDMVWDWLPIEGDQEEYDRLMAERLAETSIDPTNRMATVPQTPYPTYEPEKADITLPPAAQISLDPRRISDNVSLATDVLREMGVYNKFDPEAAKLNIRAQRDKLLPLMEETYDTEAVVQNARSSFLFDIAKAGLAFASGVDPTTGQNIAGKPLLAQAAMAAQPVATSAQKNSKAIAQAKRLPKIAALQSAMELERERVSQERSRESAIMQIATSLGLNRTQIEAQRNKANAQLSFKAELANAAALNENQKIGFQGKLAELHNLRRTNLQKYVTELQTIAADNRLEKQFAGRADLATLQYGLSRELAITQHLLGVQRRNQEYGISLGLLDAQQENWLDRFAEEKELKLDLLDLSQDFSEDMQEQKQLFDQNILGQKLLFEEETLMKQMASANFVASTRAATQRNSQILNAQIQMLRDNRDGLLKQFELKLKERGLDDKRAAQQAKLELNYFELFLDNEKENLISFGTTGKNAARTILADDALLNLYAQGQTTGDQTNMIETAINMLTTQSQAFSQELGEFVVMEGEGVTPAVEEAMRLRQTKGFQDGGEVVVEEEEPTRIISNQVDLTSATGVSQLEKYVSGPAQYLSEIKRGLGGEPSGEPFGQKRQQADAELKSLATATKNFLREEIAGRFFSSDAMDLNEQLGNPGGLTDQFTFEKLKALDSKLREGGELIDEILENPRQYSKSQITQARANRKRLDILLENYETAIDNFATNLGQKDKPDPALFDRSLQAMMSQ